MVVGSTSHIITLAFCSGSNLTIMSVVACYSSNFETISTINISYFKCYRPMAIRPLHGPHTLHTIGHRTLSATTLVLFDCITGNFTKHIIKNL